MPERLYSTYQVADLLGASPGTVVEWMQKGWLPFKKLPDGPVRIPGTGLIRFLKDRGIDIEEVLARLALREGRQGAEAKAAAQPPPQPVDRTGTYAAAAPRPGIQRPPVPPLAHTGAHAPASRVSAPAPGMERSLPGASSEQAVEAAAPTTADQAPQRPPPDAVEAAAAADRASQVAQAVLRDAAARRASDVYLDSAPDGLTLRLRVDGVLQEKAGFKLRLPKALAPRLIAHFKSLAELPAEQTRRAQTGTFFVRIEERRLRCRLSCWPTIHGEELAIALRDADAAPPSLSQLGLEPTDEARLRNLLAEPGGIILLAGPPRCGKDLALRALAAELNTRDRLIATIERSVEFEIPGASQSVVDERAGFTFAEAMRALSGARGDAIMTDDIPDPATALAALDAAAGGQLVLGAMNARSAASALSTLLDMGLAPWPLSSALLAVIEQRTVRKLCPQCRKQVEADDELPAGLGLKREEADFPVFAPQGCPRCTGGYSGQVNLFRVTYVEGELARSLRTRGDSESLREAGERAGVKSLRQVALEKVRAGITSLQEIARVLG